MTELAGGPASARQPVPTLRPEQAAQLRDLALIGYVRGIRMRLDEMAAEDPPAAPAVAVLRGLVAQFRLDEFMAELDRMQPGRSQAERMPADPRR